MKSSIHVFAHSHGGFNEIDTGASMDVGVDSAAKILGKYKPFSYEDVIKHIKAKKIKEGGSQ
jgi:calcineurin-like phosphoesterase family protein